MSTDKSFKITYIDLKVEIKKNYPKQMGNKMEQHPTQKTPDL